MRACASATGQGKKKGRAEISDEERDTHHAHTHAHTHQRASCLVISVGPGRRLPERYGTDHLLESADQRDSGGKVGGGGRGGGAAGAPPPPGTEGGLQRGCQSELCRADGKRASEFNRDKRERERERRTESARFLFSRAPYHAHSSFLVRNFIQGREHIVTERDL